MWYKVPPGASWKNGLTAGMLNFERAWLAAEAWYSVYSGATHGQQGMPICQDQRGVLLGALGDPKEKRTTNSSAGHGLADSLLAN